MTLITPEQKDRPNFDKEVKRIRSALSDLEVQMEGLAQQARTGEVASVKEAGKTLQELRAWMRAATELEKTLDEYHKREAGIEHGYALDLAEARRAIGCRLARIAPCCRAGRVAE